MTHLDYASGCLLPAGRRPLGLPTTRRQNADELCRIWSALRRRGHLSSVAFLLAATFRSGDFSLACAPDAMLSIWGIDYRTMYEAGDALPPLDHEWEGFEVDADEYRGPFGETLSPSLPYGLDLGWRPFHPTKSTVHRVRPVQGGDLRMRGASRADAATFGWFGTADRRQAIRASEPGICPGVAEARWEGQTQWLSTPIISQNCTMRRGRELWEKGRRMPRRSFRWTRCWT